MKYYLDTEFIEDGHTIDLLSIGLVSEDGRELYRQHHEAGFLRASDWVVRNVFSHLKHFDMSKGGGRSCRSPSMNTPGDHLTGQCKPECPWGYRWEIRDAVKAFCDPEKYGKPEIWGYYADYDWVAFCQLFGTMMELPSWMPKYCNDIKQLCKSVGDPEFPQQTSAEHNALSDAKWNREAHKFLLAIINQPPHVRFQ